MIIYLTTLRSKNCTTALRLGQSDFQLGLRLVRWFHCIILLYVAVVVTLCLNRFHDWSFLLIYSLQLLLLWLLLCLLSISFHRVLLTCHYTEQVSNRVVHAYRTDVPAPSEHLRSTHRHVTEADSVVPVVHNFFFWRLEWLV